MLYTIDIKNWQETVSKSTIDHAITALESGQVLFLPGLPFELEESEQLFLSAHFADPKTKNISYDSNRKTLKGAISTQREANGLSQMLQRYATQSIQLVNNALPHYQAGLKPGRTSYRPVEIAGRKASSYRKDDRRLHVDAFPANPTQGQRILRVFTNVNPNNEARVWRLGAPFNKVADYFSPKLSKPFPGSLTILKALSITKAKRTLYDHYMLQLHHAMKADLAYQEQVPQQEHHFPSGSTWIVYTDQVSHAVMSGQFLLEQTFYLPYQSLVYEGKSPLRTLESKFKTALL
jgi:hypothetical protein